jgi:hypothetical protein
MGRKSETSAVSALSAPERGQVLSSLLPAHPSLVAEAERVAAGLLGGGTASWWPVTSRGR